MSPGGARGERVASGEVVRGNPPPPPPSPPPPSSPLPGQPYAAEFFLCATRGGHLDRSDQGSATGGRLDDDAGSEKGAARRDAGCSAAEGVPAAILAVQDLW